MPIAMTIFVDGELKEWLDGVTAKWDVVVIEWFEDDDFGPVSSELAS